jgi:hypothetical protein
MFKVAISLLAFSGGMSSANVAKFMDYCSQFDKSYNTIEEF